MHQSICQSVSHLDRLLVNFSFNQFEVLLLGLFLVFQVFNFLQLCLDLLDRLCHSMFREQFLRLFERLLCFVQFSLNSQVACTQRFQGLANLNPVLWVKFFLKFQNLLQLLDCLRNTIVFLQDKSDIFLDFESFFMSFFKFLFVDLELFVQRFDFLLVIVGFLVEFGQKFIVVSDFNDVLVLDVFEGLDGDLKGFDCLMVGFAFADKNFCFFHAGLCILFGFFALFCFQRSKNFLNELQRLGVVLQLEITAGNEPQCLNIISPLELSLTPQLNVMRLLENLKGVLKAGDLKVAATIRRQDIGMVELDLVHVVDFGVLLQRHGQVVQSLFVALVVEVGLAEVVVGLNEVELGLAMGVDQYFRQSQLVHSHLEDVLCRGVREHDLLQKLIQLDFEFFADDVFFFFCATDLFHDEILQLDFGFLFVVGVISLGLWGEVFVILVIVVVDLCALLEGLFFAGVGVVVLHWLRVTTVIYILSLEIQFFIGFMNWMIIRGK